MMTSARFCVQSPVKYWGHCLSCPPRAMTTIAVDDNLSKILYAVASTHWCYCPSLPTMAMATQ